MQDYGYDDFPPVFFRIDDAFAWSRFPSQPFFRRADSFRA